MKADEVKWTSKPDADRARRLMRLLFQADEQPQASERGES